MIRVEAFVDAASSAVVEQIDDIFFEASPRTAFASAAERTAYRERWLGRYLTYYAQEALVARDEDGRVVGYLVGSLDDPARTKRFADISYFAGFSDLTVRYPAHLHINLDPGWRNMGIGGMLIDAFVVGLMERHTPGVHVVTGAAARNLPFYQRRGFVPLRQALWNGAPILFMGRDLGPKSSVGRGV
jgi:GNAT superfamily N-acetyltransferase